MFVPTFIVCIFAAAKATIFVKWWVKFEEPKGKKPAKKEEVVFVVNEGVVEQVAVVTGISDDTNVEIVSGVEEGQEVVSGSYKALSLQLKDGSSIKIKEDLTYRETSE